MLFTFQSPSLPQTMTSYRTEVEPSVVLPDAATQAANATRSRPITSLNSLTSELSSNQNLHAAFHRQLQQSIQERVAQDPDYTPAKFPNTEKKFNSKEDDKQQ